MTSAKASAVVSDRDDWRLRVDAVTARLVAPATMIVILAIALLVLMSPFWIHFALDTVRGPGAEPPLWLSDRTVKELFLGPGTFYDFVEDEAGHMRDVRVVLQVFLALALASAGVIGWQLWRHPDRPQLWRSIARGGLALSVTILVLGVFAAVAFDAAFELFHRVLFPGGNWSFPADSLLIQLYPYAFWELTSAALGVLAIGGGLVVWLVARRRARTVETRAGAVEAVSA
jgi:integral membrane protein (TIGR01906 family)